MPVREYIKFDGIDLVALRHEVDMERLQDFLNLYASNAELPSIAAKRKYLQKLEDLLGKVSDIYNSIEDYASVDAILELQQANTRKLHNLPAVKKGPNHEHRHRLMHQLKELYPGETGRSKHPDTGKPSGPFFRFCRDAFNLVEPEVTDEVISHLIAK